MRDEKEEKRECKSEREAGGEGTKRFMRSLKYTNVGQKTFIIPNSQ